MLWSYLIVSLVFWAKEPAPATKRTRRRAYTAKMDERALSCYSPAKLCTTWEAAWSTADANTVLVGCAMEAHAAFEPRINAKGDEP